MTEIQKDQLLLRTVHGKQVMRIKTDENAVFKWPGMVWTGPVFNVHSSQPTYI